MTRPLLSFFVLPLLAASAAAQFTEFGVGKRRIMAENPVGELNGPMTKTIALDTIGDARPDVMMMVDDRLVISFSPGIYHDSQIVVSGGEDVLATDIVAVPGAGFEENDAFLVSSSDPFLKLFSYNLDDFEFTFTPLGGPFWKNARHMRVGDVDGDGALDLVAVNAGGQVLLFMYDLMGMFGTPQQSMSMYGSTIHTLKLVEWDGDDGFELAILSDGGIQVREHDGSEVPIDLPASSNDRLAIIKREGQVDRIAFLTQIAVNHFLYAFDKDLWDGQLLVGPIDLVEGVSGDWDANKLGDILVSHKTQGNLVYLQNQGPGGASFSWGDGISMFLDPTEDGSGDDPAPENEAIPTFTDLDLDGDSDIFFPVEKERSATMIHSDFISWADNCVNVEEGTYTYTPGAGGTLDLSVMFPMGLPDEMDDILLTVWEQLDGEGVNPTAYYSDVLSKADPYQVLFAIDQPEDSKFIYHVETRPVELGADGRIKQSTNATIFSFTLDEAKKDALVASNNVDPNDVVDITVIIDGGGPDEGGWTVPLVCLPDFFDDDFIPPNDR